MVAFRNNSWTTAERSEIGGVSPNRAYRGRSFVIFRIPTTRTAMATPSLADIEALIKERAAQIAELRAAAAKQRQEEISEVLQDVRQKIAEYGISAKELGLTVKPGAPRRRVAAAPTGPTYRGPNRETWVGGTRGRKPSCLSGALAQGKTLSDFAV